MTAANTVQRTQLFRAMTIVASGFGAAMLALWALDLMGVTVGSVSDSAIFGSVVLGLAALAGAGSAHAYFAGTDDTVSAYDAQFRIDEVTGLLSKAGLIDAVNTPLAEHRPGPGQKRFLVSLDFGSLKEINETYGEDTGDALLRVFADRLRRIVGNAGPIGRSSGGEFVVVVNVEDNQRELRAAVEALLGVMALPVRIGAASHSVFWNAGVAEIHDGELALDKVMRSANLARTNANAAGRGTWSIYHPEMSQLAAYRRWIETELHQALKRNELFLNYQPKVRATTGEIVGFEALLRWTHHAKGIIPPAEFIPVAESCGLIHQIGDWVLNQVCEDLSRLPVSVPVSANVSPAQIDSDDFSRKLEILLQNHDVQPGRLEIEITESLLIQRSARTRKILADIRKLGVLLAIDDFGTGYSNLSTLAEIEFHTLKVDRSFVERLGSRAAAGTMISTVVGMARSLNAEVVAEGVETKEQVILLQAAGCNIMQGYYFGKPALLATILDDYDNGERADALSPVAAFA